MAAPGPLPAAALSPGAPTPRELMHGVAGVTSRAGRDREAGSVLPAGNRGARKASRRSSSRSMSRDNKFSKKDCLSIRNVVASIQTKEGLNLKLISGDVLYIWADVIVNSVPMNLQLGGGPLSRAFLQKAGPMLQKELDDRRRETEEKVGNIFMTSGCNLDCKAVLHAVAPYWNNGAETSWQVATGDIATEQVDVIVNSTARTFNRKSGVSKAILEGAGQAVESECAVLAAQPHRDFIITPGGCLKCKIIIHVPGRKDVRKTVTSVLEECEQRKYTSVSLPAIGTGNLPEHWTDMNHQLFCMVQLEPGQSEYNIIKDKFTRTCSSYAIEKIERIQNAFLWQSYQVKKRQMDIKNDRKNNERLLFHGTDADSVPYVNQHGFNRSCAGKNAVSYGKGTYFAVDASYSAKDTYSKPDSNGRKHMYVVRVLTGVFTKGRAGLVTPPPKNPHNPTDLFDSVTNNTRSPKLFVVFFDNQAYPEYLITFTA
ncbi:protein mono-ADP-ribosyltransferase PARP15 isoform X18 [Pan troglodytes]|uniref:Poly [ADP-ribose] polymerase n=1 Tax=Pan troglodytes TaxID=9598 RepID=A0A2I3RJ99_PANTR